MADDIGPWCDRWGLTPNGDVLETPSSTVAFVRRGAEPAVLKIVNQRSDEARSPAALRLWDGAGAVRLLEWEARVSLLERAVPGTPLESLTAAGNDDAATAILADAMLALRRPEPPPGDWPTTEVWAEGFTRQRARGAHPVLTERLLDRGEATFRDLCRDTPERFFLHGDLHHTNVLLDDRRGWLVIDPKGIVGDAAFEVAMALGNPASLFPMQTDPAIMARRVAIYAERLGLDRRRILGWAFGQMVLSACWHVEDGDDDSQTAGSLAVARTAETLLAGP